MLKKVVVGASALVLAGGAFMTAQALTPHGHGLPTVNAPLTVQPASTKTARTTSPVPTAPATTTRSACRGEDDSPNSRDRHGRASDGAYGSRCRHQLHTVVPSPSVFTDDHGHHAEPGDDHGGHGEAEPGDDHGGQSHSEPGDDNGGHGEAEPGDDHGGSGSGSSDDHGGQS